MPLADADGSRIEAARRGLAKMDHGHEKRRRKILGGLHRLFLGAEKAEWKGLLRPPKAFGAPEKTRKDREGFTTRFALEGRYRNQRRRLPQAEARGRTGRILEVPAARTVSRSRQAEGGEAKCLPSFFSGRMPHFQKCERRPHLRGRRSPEGPFYAAGRSISGNHPFPASSRSASAAISGFFSFSHAGAFGLLRPSFSASRTCCLLTRLK